MTPITPATSTDAAAILALQQLAYQSEARLYNDWNIPPLTQTLDELGADFAAKTFLKALNHDEIIGSVRAYQSGETAWIERLIVHPDYQRQGIGTALMKQIEAEFESAQHYELFTGQLSERNLALYQRLGYKPFKVEEVSSQLSFVFLEKRNLWPSI